MKFITALLALVALPIAVGAHHSRAGFDVAVVREVEGRLVQLRWANPHPGFIIEVLDEDGEKESWYVEGWSSLYGYDRMGISRESFVVGSSIKVAGHPSTRGRREFLATHVLLASGTEVILRRDADPHWSARHVGGQQRWAADTQRAVVNAARENRGIFRVWSYPSPDFATRQHLPFTTSALAARAAFDPQDNYLVRCEQKGMPSSMVTPHPYEFVDNGDTITIRGHEFDVVRTIHMNDSPDAVSQAPSRQGFSVGRWEGKTLVIRTSRIDWPFFDMMETPQTDAVEVVERYTLSADQTRLDFHVTVTDPATFTEPATYEYYWLALGETIEPYRCETQ